ARRIRTFIQTPLEEKWITDFYDSDKLVNKIAKSLAPIIEKEDACQLIRQELKNSIKIKEIEVLEPEPEMGELTDVTYDTKKNKVYLPCRSSNGLEAVLVLGQKISEDSYSEKDMTLFRTLMIQAQVVLDRIRPYENIKKEFEANQQRLYEAEIELERSQRLASIGTLTAGVTHEIRNPLTVIRAQTARLPKVERDQTFIEEHTKLILSEVDRIANIVNRMLGLAKDRKGQEVDVDLNEIIECSLQSFEFDGVKLTKDLQAIRVIKGDPVEFQEVFCNLIQNAYEAMPEGGKLTIKSYTDEKDRLIIEVTDTGKGIPEDLHEKVFDPFFSTRHEGTGLGLSIVYRIIRSYGGDIHVDSKEGRGTMFRISFD
ncbi:MAG: ATP-binding protein, partial [bacterium]